MVFLAKKKSGNCTYYQIVEGVVVNGKSTHRVLKHLGTAQNLFNLIMGFEEPIVGKVSCLDYGDVVLLHEIAREMEFTDIINRHTSKERKEGLTPGESITIMTINRCVDPCSKLRVEDWIRHTYLPAAMDIDVRYVASHNLYAHMDYLTDETVRKIEHDLWKVLVSKYGIDPSHLLYDTTSIYFFMAEHKDNELPNRGYPRGNFKPGLRQVNIALLVTARHGFPLTHMPFEGNINDVTQFKNSIEMLAERYKEFAQGCKDITVMFDKGNNSKKIKELKKYHFIGSLRLDHHRKLLNSIPLSTFKGRYRNSRGKITRFYTMESEVFGGKRRLVVTFNQDIYKQKSKRFNEQLENAWKELNELEGKLNNNKFKKWKSRDSVLVKVNEILKQYRKTSYIGYKLTDDGKLELKLWKKTKQIERQEMLWGKNILFTDRRDWKPEKIIEAYRSKNVVEDAIKVLKGPIKIDPVRHFKDRRIKEHIVICIFGLLFLAMLRYKLDKAGVDMSVDRCLRELGRVRHHTFRLKNVNKVFEHVSMDEKLKETFNKVISNKEFY